MNDFFNEIEKYRIEEMENYIDSKINDFEGKIIFYKKYSNFDEDNKFLLNSTIKEIDLINYEIISLKESIVKRIVKKNSYNSIGEIRSDEKSSIRNVLINQKQVLNELYDNLNEMLNDKYKIEEKTGQ